MLFLSSGLMCRRNLQTFVSSFVLIILLLEFISLVIVSIDCCNYLCITFCFLSNVLSLILLCLNYLSLKCREGHSAACRIFSRLVGEISALIDAGDVGERDGYTIGLSVGELDGGVITVSSFFTAS